MEARHSPYGASTMHQQAVGGDQQHLEGNEKVEQVTGQEGDVESHQLEQEQGVELSVTLVAPPMAYRCRTGPERRS